MSELSQPAETPRFLADVRYDHIGWWAVVRLEGQPMYYWEGAAFTRWGARLSARWKAWRLTRARRKGRLR